MDQEKIGKFISELRKSRGLTQIELADMLGVTFQAVSKWERGKNAPDIAVLKDISRLFNVDINDILNGETKKKHNNKLYYILGGLLVLILLVIITSLLGGNNHDFEFKQISTSCENFNIAGSMAYNKDKTSLYISNVEFCGSDDNETYESIGCTLYEDHDGEEIEISSCKIDNDITLEEYLKDVRISVDNYELSCTNMLDSELYLEINATLENNKNIVYKIPITLLENSCSN